MSDEKNIPDWIQNLLSEEDKFWTNIYPTFSFDEKIKHWSSTLYRQMRSQAESGLDPYSIYSSQWYEKVKKTEPLFDEIINIVFTRYWKNVWSKEEYIKRINDKSQRA